MPLLLEKTEKKNEIEYRIKPKLWFSGWVVVIILFSIGFVYRMKNPYLFLGGWLVFFVWMLIVGISIFPIWIAFYTNKTISKEGFLWKTVWKLKK